MALCWDAMFIFEQRYGSYFSFFIWFDHIGFEMESSHKKIHLLTSSNTHHHFESFDLWNTKWGTIHFYYDIFY